MSETNDEYPKSDYSPEIGRFRPCNTTTVLEEDFKEFVTAVLTLDVDPNAVRPSSLNSGSSPSSASSSPSTTYAVPSTNAVSSALNVAAWIIAAICTIAALICFAQEDDFLLTTGFALLGSGLISALFFLALSEIVHLLTQIRDKIK